MSAVTGYDITIWCSVEGHGEVLYESVECFLKRIAKQWVFQQETTQMGKLHYQIRLRLKEKRRLTPFIRFCHQNEEGIPKGAFGCISITSSTVHSTSDFNYVMKEDSRVDGPWRNDKPVKRKTAQLLEFENLEKYHWQSDDGIVRFFHKVDFRKIYIILDLHGHSGKSIMAEYLEFHFDAEELPPLRDMKDLMQAVMGLDKRKNYIIDMPRGMKKDQLAGMYSGIECLKNGIAYDTRYAFKKQRFDRPNIFVFTNQLPDVRLLTADRWRLFRIDANKQLVDVNLPPGWNDSEGNQITIETIDQGKYDRTIPRMGLQPARVTSASAPALEGPFAHPERGAGADTSSQHSLGSIPSDIAEDEDLPLEFLLEEEE